MTNIIIQPEVIKTLVDCIVDIIQNKIDWQSIDWQAVAEKAVERPKNEWIPVSERLPERYKDVIVTDIETSDVYQSQYIGNGFWECDNGTLKNRIIAWMPLPEPYEKEAENG